MVMEKLMVMGLQMRKIEETQDHCTITQGTVAREASSQNLTPDFDWFHKVGSRAFTPFRSLPSETGD